MIQVRGFAVALVIQNSFLALTGDLQSSAADLLALSVRKDLPHCVSAVDSFDNQESPRKATSPLKESSPVSKNDWSPR